MMSIDDIKAYLPKYLSIESEKNLFEQLNNFPSNMDRRLYTTKLREDKIIYQGDGMEGLLIINLPDQTVKNSSAMIISNTCDIGQDKHSPLPNNVVYSSIFNYDKYIALVKSVKGDNDDYLRSHEASLKQQAISSIFYLPKGGRLANDSLVFFDKVVSCQLKHFDTANVNESRIFTLSDYGFYLFLFKLSIHFTRIRERVDRGMN